MSLKDSSEASASECDERARRMRTVEDERNRMAKRLSRDKIAPVFHLQVYAFNCSDARHDRAVTPDPFHIEFCAGSTPHLGVIPDSVQVTIRALEAALAELKKRVQ